MVQNVEMLVELFDNGISINVKSVNGEYDPTSIVALNGDEASSIGKLIWEDLYDLFESHLACKVSAKIEYELLDEI